MRSGSRRARPTSWDGSPPDGQITEYPVSALPNGHPKAITAGPDGALWFTDNRSDGAYIVRAG